MKATRDVRIVTMRNTGVNANDEEEAKYEGMHHCSMLQRSRILDRKLITGLVRRIDDGVSGSARKE